MSVINQMLKDLEQRQGEQPTHSGAVNVPVAMNKSNYKTAFLIVITIIITLFVVYALQLRDENLRLQNVSVANQNEKILAPTLAGNSVQQKELKRNTDSYEQVSNPQAVSTNTIPQTTLLPAGTSAVNNNSAGGDTTVDADKYSQNIVKSTPSSALPSINIVVEPLPVQAQTEVKKQSTSSNQPKEQKPAASMVISRKELAPEALAQQKMARAREALENNEVSKAETLFEDILIIQPNQKDARKQLAALWFGRQSSQSAINLLSQGIQLDPEDKELRVLQAQIYSKNNAHYQAYKTLQSHPYLSDIDDVNYLSMLATQAQSSKQFRGAIDGYKQLSNLQPTVGRWWLGLGIAYDSNGEFKLASHTYQMAISQLNLSDSAKQFVSQRLTELGEQ